jgi:SAM-dependent methyltransferase
MRDFCIKHLASDWEAMMYQLIEDKKTNPIVPYQPTIPYQIKETNGNSITDTIDEHITKSFDDTSNIDQAIVKLNIAAGPNVFPFPGWINYDKEDFSQYFAYISNPKTGTAGMPAYQVPLANYCQQGGKIDFRRKDCTKPFEEHSDNSVDFIYVGQAIEHLNPIYQAPQFLKECHRMLKPGGVLRMTTPDLNGLLDAYQKREMDRFAEDQPAFYKEADPAMQLSLLMFGTGGENCTQQNFEGHFACYSKSSMNKLLLDCKFREIVFYQESGVGKLPNIAKEVVDFGTSHSLIVECTK